MPDSFKPPKRPGNLRANSPRRDPPGNKAAENDVPPGEASLLHHMRRHYEPALLKLLRRARGTRNGKEQN